MQDVGRAALGTIVAGAQSQPGLGLGVTLGKPSLKRRPFRLNSCRRIVHRGASFSCELSDFQVIETLLSSDRNFRK